jgi:hypothetical protein
MAQQPEPADGEPAPPDGARQLGELWAFGLETSQAMSERVTAMYRDLPGVLQSPGADLDTEIRRLRIDVERAVDLAVDVFDRVLALSRRVVGSMEPSPDAAGADDVVVVRVAPGGDAVGVLWIHNRSGVEQPAPALWCSELRTGDGYTIGADHVDVHVGEAPIAAWNSRGAEVRVAVGPATPTGIYHGLVLARDDPGTSFQVRVDVTDVVVDLPTRDAG